MNIPALPSAPRVALIAGPTASGKSALALALAESLNGIVINADSAQVYADLRILSARPSPAEEQRVPHRLFGHVRATDSYSAVRWSKEATAEIAAAHTLGRLPILVGGTGLYIRTLLDGIAPVPDIDPAVRSTVRALPVAQAHRDLSALDPDAAARLAAADSTRVARALEVVLSTGKTLAAWQADRSGGIADRITLEPLILLPDRNWLVARCDDRLAKMLAAGADKEVRTLMTQHDLPPEASVMRAIGVREIAGWLRGDYSESSALAQAQVATRRYAKRQFTWFRHQSPSTWPRTALTTAEDQLGFYLTCYPRSG